MELGIWFQPETWAAQELAPDYLLGENAGRFWSVPGVFQKAKKWQWSWCTESAAILSPMVKMVYLITAVYDAAVYDSTEPSSYNNRTLF